MGRWFRSVYSCRAGVFRRGVESVGSFGVGKECESRYGRG